MAKKRIMVCVTGQKACEKLILAGDSLKESETDELYIVHILNSDHNFDGIDNSEALDYLFDLAGAYGATVQVFNSGNFIDRISEFANSHKIDTCVLGASQDKKKQKSTVFRLKRKIDREIDVSIIDSNGETK